jgi:hypothetical protein
MEPEGSLLCSQETAYSYPYSEPVESSSHLNSLRSNFRSIFSGLFISEFQNLKRFLGYLTTLFELEKFNIVQCYVTWS